MWCRNGSWVVLVAALAACDAPVRDVGEVPAGRVEVLTRAAAPAPSTTGPTTLDPTFCACADDGNPCTDDYCDADSRCLHPPKADGTGCDDMNACTRLDVCKVGTCVGGNPVVCAGSECLDPGVCDRATGVCSQGTPKPDGTSCSDGSACTRGDSCQSGACKGGDPVLCLGEQCREAGVCDPATGGCPLGAAKTDGSPCDDGNACTRTDACQAGACQGASPVICQALSQCHDIGVCDPASGVCSNPARPTGAPCSDAKPCTYGETCDAAGQCQGGKVVTCQNDACYIRTCNGTADCTVMPKAGAPCDDGEACTYSDVCSASGVCGGSRIACVSDESATRACNGTQTCTVTPRPGAACDDGNPCTKGDVRQPDGSCGGMPYSCPVTACLVSSTCDGLGGCRSVAKADGTGCDADGNQCTPRDVCKGGACIPDPKPVVCTRRDCNTAQCDPMTGNCRYLPTSGDPCGLTGCFSTGMCQEGVCSGRPKDCSPFDGPCTVGICDAASGDCLAAPKPNGTSCAAGGRCAVAAACVFGVCELAANSCPVASTPCKLPACDPATGQCVERERPVGAPCDPKNSCMSEATCDEQGRCTGAPAPNGDPCTLPGGQIGRCVVGSCTTVGGSGAGGGGGPNDAGVPAGIPTSGGGGGGGCTVGHGNNSRVFALLVLALALFRFRSRRRRLRR